MSNIYIYVIIEKNWRSQTSIFRLLVSFWGASTHADTTEF